MNPQLYTVVLILLSRSFNFASSEDNGTQTPIVLWHGMGEQI